MKGRLTAPGMPGNQSCGFHMHRSFLTALCLLALGFISQIATASAQDWQKVTSLDKLTGPLDFRFCDYRVVYHSSPKSDVFFPLTIVSQYYDVNKRATSASAGSAVNWYEVQFLADAFTDPNSYTYLRKQMNSNPNRPFDFRLHLVFFENQKSFVSLGYNQYNTGAAEVYGYFPTLKQQLFDLEKSCRLSVKNIPAQERTTVR